jgi:hypothetical protein
LAPPPGSLRPRSWTLMVIIALVTIGFQLADPLYRTGVIGVAIWYALEIRMNPYAE